MLPSEGTRPPWLPTACLTSTERTAIGWQKSPALLRTVTVKNYFCSGLGFSLTAPTKAGQATGFPVWSEI